MEFTLDGEPLSDAWVALFQDDEFIDGLSFDWDTGYFKPPCRPESTTSNSTIIPPE